MKVSEKTGRVVSIKSVVPGEELMLITRNGVVNRQSIDSIRIIGRATQGVRLVALDDADAIMDVARIIPEDEEEGEEGVEVPGAEAAVVADEEGEGD
jgi:DNA gyrase subunit A